MMNYPDLDGSLITLDITDCLFVLLTYWTVSSVRAGNMICSHCQLHLAQSVFGTEAIHSCWIHEWADGWGLTRENGRQDWKRGERKRRTIRDNNTSIAPKLTENPGATIRPVTTLQMAALEMALISSSSERGHHPPQNASKLATRDARSVSVLQSFLWSSIHEG